VRPSPGTSSRRSTRRSRSSAWCSTRSPTTAIRAIDEPRDLDRRLVDAQEARRLLDRLYGYEVSPVLWKKVLPQLSAGRVQSVATRIVVERERERMAFVAASYWDIEGTFAADSGTDDAPTFDATLVAGRRHPGGHQQGLRLERSAHRRGRRPRRAGRGVARRGARPAPTFEVRSVESRPYRRRPAAPFMTSTYQQEASRKLRLSSAQAMRAAQTLYEQGYITYMRTDSTTLSETALSAARSVVAERYGASSCPTKPAATPRRSRTPRRRTRPSAPPATVPVTRRGRQGGPAEARVYEMIWNRTVASQMTDATRRDRHPAARGRGDRRPRRRVLHQRHRHHPPGVPAVYVEDTDESSDDAQERRLPRLAEGDQLTRSICAPTARDPAAVPLQRGVAHQAARGARRGPSVHLRLDHGHHPGPGLRVEEGQRPGAVASPPSRS
jgi:DNA topoisomerase I